MPESNSVEMVHTAFGEKRVHRYHCPERSLGNGTYIPASDSYLGATGAIYGRIMVTDA